VPIRPFHIVPRELGDLAEAGSAQELPQRMLEAMRQVQYAGADHYHASAMEARSREGTKKIRFAVWGPGVDYVFPDVEYLALTTTDEPPRALFVPYERLPDLAGKNWSWLDERQTMVEAVAEDDWPELVERAREYEVKPLDEE
jgi:hypothetical protein